MKPKTKELELLRQLVASKNREIKDLNNQLKTAIAKRHETEERCNLYARLIDCKLSTPQMRTLVSHAIERQRYANKKV